MYDFNSIGVRVLRYARKNFILPCRACGREQGDEDGPDLIAVKYCNSDVVENVVMCGCQHTELPVFSSNPLEAIGNWNYANQ